MQPSSQSLIEARLPLKQRLFPVEISKENVQFVLFNCSIFLFFMCAACFFSGGISLGFCRSDYHLNNGLGVGSVLLVAVLLNPVLAFFSQLRTVVFCVLFLIINLICAATSVGGVLSGLFGFYCESNGWHAIEANNKTSASSLLCGSAYFGWEGQTCMPNASRFDSNHCMAFVPDRLLFLLMDLLLAMASLAALGVFFVLVKIALRTIQRHKQDGPGWKRRRSSRMDNVSEKSEMPKSQKPGPIKTVPSTVPSQKKHSPKRMEKNLKPVVQKVMAASVFFPSPPIKSGKIAAKESIPDEYDYLGAKTTTPAKAEKTEKPVQADDIYILPESMDLQRRADGHNCQSPIL